MTEHEHNCEGCHGDHDHAAPNLVASVYIMNSKGEILLISDAKWGNKLVPPGGRMEFGESIENSLQRKISETLGIELKNLRLLDYADMMDKEGEEIANHTVSLEFKAEIEAGEEEKLLPVEDNRGQYHWLLPAEAVQKENIEGVTKNIIEKHLSQGPAAGKESEKAAEYRLGWQRALADYHNLQKEVAKQKAEWAALSELQILEEFIPVYDHFKKAFAFSGTGDAQFENWKKGIGFIMKQFADILKAHSIEEILTVGQQFDPSRHEIVGEEESDKKEHEIIREIDGGYTLKGRVVKVAKVIVSKGKA
jgi:molecular chaperone GrpE